MIDRGNVIFQEIQYMRQPWAISLIVITTIPGPAVIPYFIYRQIVLGKPAGNNPISDNALWLVAALVVLFEAGLLWLFLATKLITQVRTDGLYIKYFPFHLSERKIPLENVASIEAVTYSPLKDYGGWGIKYVKNGRAYNVMGNRGVKLTYSDGKHILIGSQKPDELDKAIESIS